MRKAIILEETAWISQRPVYTVYKLVENGYVWEACFPTREEAEKHASTFGDEND